jgi:folate-binding protein YgfZ
MSTDTTPFFVTLKNRGLLHLEGADRHDFLQGLITQDIRKLAPGKALYGALLTPQGKFMHDFFLHEGDGFTLIDCEGGQRAQDLFKRLSMYRLRKDVQISVEEHHPVYAIFGTEIGVPDPRHEDMGYRSFEKPELEEKSFEEWDTRRIALTIPDGSRDMIVERSFPLECHLDTLHALDFEKGCYMGQELTARTHHRGLLKKHLYTVHFEGAAPAPFTDLENGGNMRSSCGQTGLALLKDEEAERMRDEHDKIHLLGL